VTHAPTHNTNPDSPGEPWPQQPLIHALGLPPHVLADRLVSQGRRIIGGKPAIIDAATAAYRSRDLAGLQAICHTSGISHATIAPIVRTHISESHEGTVLKFTQSVVDGRPGRERERVEIESVLIPMIGKRRIRAYTLCVSSQVGCAMGCHFCQTAQMGLLRSLQAGEIVQQWMAGRMLLDACKGDAKAATEYLAATSEHLADAGQLDRDAEIRNIVFMGMGEPMDNIEQVTAAIDVLIDPRASNLAPSRITVSTVGKIDGMQKFRAYVSSHGRHRVGLAVSLNGSNDQVRGGLMPINRRYDLQQLRQVIEHWPFFSSTHACLEYVLIPGVNDQLCHADELAALVKGDAFGQWPGAPEVDAGIRRWSGRALQAMVNLIPYNPRENSPWPAPQEEVIDAFLARLTQHGVYCKRRRTKGRDQMAACGQLGNLAYRRTRTNLTISS
jgi:23S rRNA (adenine2503-C2)-methyltransferase